MLHSVINFEVLVRIGLTFPLASIVEKVGTLSVFVEIKTLKESIHQHICSDL